MTDASTIDRRDFLQAAGAGLAFAFTLTADAVSVPGAAAADAPLGPNLWVTIATDGAITIVSPPAELGQGTFTTLAAVLADELDADWSRGAPIMLPVWDERPTAIRSSSISWIPWPAGYPRLLEADADRGRAGAARSPPRGRGPMERAGRRALDRAQRGRACALRTSHRLWRDRVFRQGPRPRCR